MIALTKEIFEGSRFENLGNYSSDFNSINRMDIVNLAGIHKYNALTIFQRVLIVWVRFTRELRRKRKSWEFAKSPLNSNRLVTRKGKRKRIRKCSRRTQCPRKKWNSKVELPIEAISMTKNSIGKRWQDQLEESKGETSLFFFFIVSVHNFLILPFDYFIHESNKLVALCMIYRWKS